MKISDMKNQSNDPLSYEEKELAAEIQKRIDNTNTTQLINNWEIGQLIEKAYGKKKNYGTRQIEKIANHLGGSPNTLYGYWRLAKNYGMSDIHVLAHGKFSTPYKLLKSFGSIGRYEFMRIYEKVDTLKEFKDELKERWVELKAAKEIEKAASQKDTSDDKAQPAKGTTPHEIATEDGGEKFSPGTNSDLDQKEDGAADPDKAEEVRQVEPVKNPEGENEVGVEEPIPSDEDSVAPDDTDEGYNPDATNIDAIKKAIGAAAKIESPTPAEPSGSTFEDTLKGQACKSLSESDEGILDLASAMEKLAQLESENEQLKSENEALRDENELLKQTVKELEAQSEEREEEYA